eukprot:649652-Rhodomonas_salina.5
MPAACSSDSEAVCAHTAAGGLANVVDERVMRLEMRPTIPEGEAITAEHLNVYCTRWVTPTLSRDGFCGYSIRFLLFPWIENGMDGKMTELYQRLANSVRVMKNVWRQVGLDKHLHEERPAEWIQGPIQAGCSTDPTQPAEDLRNEARAAAWRDAAAASTGARADTVDAGVIVV